MNDLKGKRIAILATDGFEQSELESPLRDLESHGASVKIIGLKKGKIQGYRHLDKGDAFPVDLTIEDAKVTDFDVLVLPGGVHNPDTLRTSEVAMGFVRDFNSSGKTIAAICHGSWSLIEAGITKGRKLTSWPSLKTDLRNSGADWVDKEVEVDRNFITSRKPSDLVAFNAAIVAKLRH